MNQRKNKERKFRCTMCRRISSYPPNAPKNWVILVCGGCSATKMKKRFTAKDRAMLTEFAKTISVGKLKKLGQSAQVET